MLREENEEDLSFLDEEFFGDIFPAAPPSTSGPTFRKPATSLPHHSFTTAQVTPVRGGLNGETAARPFLSTQLNKGLDKLTEDYDDEFDDDLSLETIDEEKISQSLEDASTPPDSAFFQSSMNHDMSRRNQTGVASTTTAAQSTDSSNFRFKLLQTIKRTKESSGAESGGRQDPPVPLLQTGDKRSPEVLDKDFTPCVKRKSIEAFKAGDGPSFVCPIPPPVLTQKSQNAVRCGGSRIQGPLVTGGAQVGGSRIQGPLVTGGAQVGGSRIQGPLVTGGAQVGGSRIQGPLVTGGAQVGGSRKATHPLTVAPSRPILPQPQKTASVAAPVVQKRKFPGPAGILLPQQEDIATVAQVPEEDEPHRTAPESTANVFAEGPWQQLLRDLEVEPGAAQCPLGVLTVRWVVRQASVRGQAGLHKVPFLAVLVHSLEPCDTVAATAILRDPTGEMNGSIAVEVLREYGEVVQVGCVLLLRGVTVFTPGGLGPPGGREHHRSHRHLLNIVLSSLLSIYTADNTGQVLTTTANGFDRRELRRQAATASLATAGLDQSVCEVEEDEASEAVNTSTSLFSTVNRSSAVPPGQHGAPSSPRFPGQHNPRPGHHRPSGTLHRPPGTPHRPVNHRLPAGNPTRCPNPYRSSAPTMRHPTPGGPLHRASPTLNPQPTQAFPAVHGHTTTSPAPTAGKQQFHFRKFATQPSTQPFNKQQPGKPPSMQHKPVLLEKNAQLSAHSNTLAHLSSKNNSNTRSAGVNSSMLPSQEEEKQITELLAGIDEDSLFGDF